MPQIDARGLWSTSSRVNTYTESEKKIQQILAITSALVSLSLGLLTLYWFLRMRKSLRHHLIMLLIVSGWLKTLGYFIPAVAVLAGGRPISAKFCQFTGFITALGIEAADFIILLIALHTVLSIVRVRRSTREAGLSPYRHTAYTAYVIFATLTASLAFINPNKEGAYISQGTYCYLPVRPFWYRLALSWIPRYLILSAILTIYATIYIYTKAKLGSIGTVLNTDSFDSECRGQSISSRNVSVTGQTSVSEMSTTQPTIARPNLALLRLRTSFGRKDLTSPMEDSRARRPSVRFSSDVQTFNRNADPIAETVSESDEILPGLGSDVDLSHRKPTLIEALRDTRLMDAALNRGNRHPNSTLHQRHRAIKRQLRHMFIYPLVYLLMWLAPFVNHCYNYQESYSPPFSLNCIALVCVCLQCAVDCLIFGSRDKPWRHAIQREVAERARKSSNRSSHTECKMSPTSPIALPEQPLQLLQLPPARYWWDHEVV